VNYNSSLIEFKNEIAKREKLKGVLMLIFAHNKQNENDNKILLNGNISMGEAADLYHNEHDKILYLTILIG